LTPPTSNPPPIFADNDAKAHACTAVTGIAQPTQLQQAIAKWIDHHYGRWWRRDYDRGRNWRPAIFWRDHNPGPVGTLLIASTLIVTVATGPQLTLRRYEGAAGTADDCADSSATPATQCSTYDCPGSTADKRAA
jgi:hypothetical protein